MDGWRYRQKFLTKTQEELLRRLASELQTDDAEIMKGILESFCIPRGEQS
jgi:hypothetical protein